MPVTPTRRTVVKAGAWTAPAIVVTSAVPAVAASISATMRVAPFNAEDGRDIRPGTGGFSFNSDVNNIGTATTTQLGATIQVTATTTTQWGTNPSLIASSPNTQSAWTILSAPTGTGATRSWLLDATSELGF